MMRLVAFGVTLLLLSACSAGDGHRQEAADPSAVCAPTNIVSDALDRRKLDLTYAEIVKQTEPNVVNRGVSAILGMALADQSAAPTDDGDLGPYLPVFAYLAERGLAWDEEPGGEVPEPERTEEVLRSAEQLDEDLTAGLCTR